MHIAAKSHWFTLSLDFAGAFRLEQNTVVDEYLFHKVLFEQIDIQAVRTGQTKDWWSLICALGLA